ncbi:MULTISPECIES: ABC transporter ATP-binding protein [Aminobacterium]|jgi:peptide/nickel transport system ATP-binding protein|uniref:Oligopeptide/dipeptide ABC transporter, ATPase subunit n=1 Tax=Aminobacterium colombiense (strain DSM 12261 / ALA-1) TaxID=572547 RepID=D5EGU3_AMICL|nr:MULTISPECIES: ABC transporter ATP-binding protein [Aminobacterium]ADE57775.1 oligopeptide/dipeptide ABC transporter, ATPase subunit [Aminobacterium colombiense DSM 12261]MDD2379454.1 ABC transporter ATP-binding protein [Aminobacterium colombiense]MDD4586666.1 ABC transporter ATP-binding protein [Aminobacterium colombiense]NLK29458.1 ABC transporter ATP-binding protein [Aminobacterium colombiense]
MGDKNNIPLLDIRNLSVRFNTDSGIVHAVNNLNLSLRRGKALGFVGETGAGKTTTALAVLQLIQSPPGEITNGEIFFDGQDVMKMTEAEKRDIRGSKIAMIFQDPMTSLNPIMTVEEQIMEMISLHSDFKGEAVRKRAHEMLALVGIRPERGKEYPHQFSGGMRQRVGIAIALACEPTLLIADEPTTALDVTIQAQVLDLIKNLQKIVNTSLLLITHDLGIVAEICDEVAIMYAGRLVEYSDIRQLYSKPMHPYTQGLFNAVPKLDSEPGGKLAVISGLMPDPTDLPKGCRFSPRCPYAQDICHEKACGMKEYEPNHFVDCFFPLGMNGGTRQ